MSKDDLREAYNQMVNRWNRLSQGERLVLVYKSGLNPYDVLDWAEGLSTYFEEELSNEVIYTCYIKD